MTFLQAPKLPIENTRPMPYAMTTSGPFSYAAKVFDAFSQVYPPPLMTKNKERFSVRLVTVGISHFSEKVRWSMDMRPTHITFIEDAHPPGFASLYTLKLSKNISASPLCEITDNTTGETEILGDSTKLLKRLTPELYDDDGNAEKWEVELGKRLGATGRCYAYNTLLKKESQPLLIKMASEDTSIIESLAFKLMIKYGPLSKSMRKMMNIDDVSAQTSLDEIRRLFADVGDALDKSSDKEQSFITNNKFTAADLTFASLSLPVLLPNEMSKYYPRPSDLPDDVKKVVEELRGTTAGKHAMNMYANYRFATVSHASLIDGSGGYVMKQVPSNGRAVTFRSPLPRNKYFAFSLVGLAVAGVIGGSGYKLFFPTEIAKTNETQSHYP